MKLNFPNFLVLFRLFLVPIIVCLLLLNILIEEEVIYWGVYWTDLFAGILFIIASFTDWLDGWWARKYNLISNFGKLFDPLADKILVNSVLIIFASRGFIPIIFVIIFICRDILVDGIRMMLANNNIVLSADKLGKLKTLFQMLGLTLIFFVHFENELFFDFFNWNDWKNIVIIIPISIGMLFSIWSGVNYYVKGFPKINKMEIEK
ncbi:MAG: CDP-diacylglycerol--glycerol-3-phosphate 3-phosphatidyltransferase [Candidatus Tyloplasma litorale]|nr:MAG: CDP-diacylglycerol--glycerol-3-phosphate 3-phosphatidyltransferase [Mycoplasmatales bacterium]